MNLVLVVDAGEIFFQMFSTVIGPSVKTPHKLGRASAESPATTKLTNT